MEDNKEKLGFYGNLAKWVISIGLGFFIAKEVVNAPKDKIKKNIDGAILYVKWVMIIMFIYLIFAAITGIR